MIVEDILEDFLEELDAEEAQSLETSPNNKFQNCENYF